MSKKRKMWLDGPYPYIHSKVVPILELVVSEDWDIFYDALNECIDEVTSLIEEENRVPTKFTVLLRVDTLPMSDEDDSS